MVARLGAGGAQSSFDARFAVGVLAEALQCSTESSPVVYGGFPSCSASSHIHASTHNSLQSTAKMNKLLIALALAPAAALVAPSVPRA